MILPRLIIADERRPGYVPAGVMVAAALSASGYRVKVFAGSIDETSLREIELLTGHRVTGLDPIACENRDNLRWLFQTAAISDGINIVLADIGSRWSEDSPFLVSPECRKLYEWLECEMVPAIYGDRSSVLSVRTISEIVGQLGDKRTNDLRIHGMLFKSVVNEREFQLVDKEVGRTLTSLTVGSIPKELEPREPVITDLCGDSGRIRDAVLPISDGMMALVAMREQVKWPFFMALARACEEWGRQPPTVGRIDGRAPRIAVLRDPALMLGGDGTELLMMTLGAELVDLPLDIDCDTRGANGVYVPHGLGYMVMTKLAGNAKVRALLTELSDGEGFMLAEGGSSPLMGELVSLPRGSVEGTGRGAGTFPFVSIYGSPVFSSPQRMTATSRKRRNPLIDGDEEWIRGYISRSLTIAPRDDENKTYCWRLSREPGMPEELSDAMARGHALVTSMRIEPWGQPAMFKRWLEGCAR